MAKATRFTQKELELLLTALMSMEHNDLLADDELNKLQQLEESTRNKLATRIKEYKRAHDETN